MTFYTIEDAAELLGIPYKRLWYFLATGQLQQTTKVGRIRLFDDYAIAEIRRFFAEREPQEAR